MITSTMSEQQEQDYIQQALRDLDTRHRHRPPWAGWGQSMVSQPVPHSSWRRLVSVTCVTGSTTSSRIAMKTVAGRTVRPAHYARTR